MSQARMFRIIDVAAYLRVTHQSVSVMYAKGKLPEPDPADGIGPPWKPATIERWAEREWWGHSSLAEARRAVGALQPRNRTTKRDREETYQDKIGDPLGASCERLRPAAQLADPVEGLGSRPTSAGLELVFPDAHAEPPRLR